MRNEDFFYEGAQRSDLLDALNGYAHEGATTALEGEPGSGVSTLLGMLAMSLIGDFELIRLDGAEDLGANAVVDAMLVHFGVERAELADTLKQTLVDSRLIVVVDNAERLPEAALGTMISLKQKLGGRLAYAFGGRPGTADRLRAAGMTVADTLELPPLDAGEVILFAEQGLAMDLSLADAEAVREETGGQPGPLWQRLEERAGARPAAAVGGRRPIPLRHGLAVGALLLVVLVLWLASGDDQPEGDKVVNLQLPTPPAAQNKDDQAAPAAAKAEQPGLVSSPEQLRRALAEYNPSASDFEHAEAPPPDNDSEGKAGRTVAADDEPAGGEAASPTPASPASSAPASAPADSSASTAAGPAPKAAPADAGADKSTPVADGKPKLDGLEAELGYHQEDWLATRPAGNWFLQVTATSHEDGARSVLDRLDHKGAYYRAERGGKPVYLVLAGPYPDRDAALKARDALPENLRQAGPFPREMADIKKELH